MLKPRLLFLLLLALAAPSHSHAQAVIVGQPCGAGGLNAIAVDGTPVVCRGNPLVWTSPSGSGGSASPSGTGPVFNVTNPAYAGGAASSNADNNAQFTAAVAAAAASVNSPVSKAISATVTSTASTTVQATMIIPAGYTTLVWIVVPFCANTVTVTDSAADTFTQLGTNNVNAAAGCLRLFSTSAGGSHSSSTVTATVSIAGNNTMEVVSYPNVFATVAPTNIGLVTSTALSASQTTTRTNSTIAVGCVNFNSGASTFVGTTGLQRTVSNATASLDGIVVMENFSVPIASVSIAGTYSPSTNQLCTAVELQSTAALTGLPTLYVPSGYYYYTGGLQLTAPMTLKCEPGAFLHYTGTANFVDLGPTGLTIATGSSWPYFVDGCTFTGGPNATNVVNMNKAITIAGVRHSTFLNAGPFAVGFPYATGFTPPANGFMVAGQGANWDVEVGPQNRFLTTDGIPRNVLRMNIGALDEFSYLRFHDNDMFCLASSAFQNGSACTPAQAGIGVYTDSHTNRIAVNNMAFFNPDIIAGCSQSGAANCEQTVIEQNNLTPALGGTGNAFPPILFDVGMSGLSVSQNTADMANLNPASFVGPRTASATLQGARINFNTISGFSAATPVIQLNNLTGQGNNQSSNNLCKTASAGISGAYVPCVIPHTTGANITPFNFNNDDLHLSFGYQVNGTTFTASGCTNSALTGGATAGTFTVGQNTACTIVITMGNALSAAHGWACDYSDLTAVPAVAIRQTASNATTASLLMTVATNDVVSFKCVGY